VIMYLLGREKVLRDDRHWFETSALAHITGAAECGYSPRELAV